MEEAALSSRLNTQEKLLISQAVYKLGAVNWEKISALLENHPVIEGRPKEWFDATTVEAYYVGLMTEIGQNVPAQDGARERAKVHLRLAQTFYLARLQELKNSIEEYEQNFSKLMTEITAIKSGSMDKVLKDEIRGVLARKYGKKLLDSWVPDEDAIKEAVEAGPPTDEELKAVEDAAEPEVGGVPAKEEVTAVVDEVKEPEAPVEEIQEPAKAEDQEAEDVTMKEPSASPTKVTTPAPEAAEASSPADKDESAVSPASDLSSVPGSPIKSRAGRGNSKRKASTQPRGAPVSKRSAKRRNTATPAVEETVPADPEAEKEQEEPEPIELVPETPAPVEDELPKRGRRTAKRESVVRRPSTRKATSPETSTRHSSPINPKRALSASSARSNSATPAAEGRPRRGRKGRGMRDEVVSKMAREQSAAEESAREEDEETPKAVEAEMNEEEPEADEEAEKEAKAEKEEEEEEEDERPATRTTRRTKSIAAPVGKEDEGQDEEEEEEGEKPPPRTSRRGKDVETPVPEKTKEVEKKSTRRSSARGVAPAEEEEKPEIKEEPKGKSIKRPRASSPREFKATRTMLNNLLDQISSHKHGSMFANPVKPNDAPGYENIIKRPMSIKTVRSRIREGQITTIDEFERDVMLIFANATMYNSRGSDVYEYAVAMMKDAEVHIKHLKNVQLQHLNRS